MTDDDHPSYAPQAARFCVWAPAIFVGVSILIRVAGDTRIVSFVSTVMAVVLLGGGIAMGVYALLHKRPDAPRRVTTHARTGIAVNAVFIVGLLVASSMQARARQAQEQRLSTTPAPAVHAPADSSDTQPARY